MMFALLDSSVWVSYFHKSDVNHGKAVELVEQLGNDGATIILPEIVYAEVTNVLIRLDSTDSLLVGFCRFVKEFDWLTSVVFGTRAFWTETVDEVAHLVQLKSLDLIVLSYAYHFDVEMFRSFDTRQDKAAKRILKR